MGAGMDAAARGVSAVSRVLVSALWAAVGVAGFSAGEPAVGLLCLAYLAYLWVLGGRWLIY